MRGNIQLVYKGKRRNFKIEVAEKLLRMPKNGGWVLPTDSEYTFTIKDGFTRRKQDKGADKKA